MKSILPLIFPQSSLSSPITQFMPQYKLFPLYPFHLLHVLTLTLMLCSFPSHLPHFSLSVPPTLCLSSPTCFMSLFFLSHLPFIPFFLHPSASFLSLPSTRYASPPLPTCTMFLSSYSSKLSPCVSCSRISLPSVWWSGTARAAPRRHTNTALHHILCNTEIWFETHISSLRKIYAIISCNRYSDRRHHTLPHWKKYSLTLYACASSSNGKTHKSKYLLGYLKSQGI